MSDQFVAEIRIFPFNFAPRGWAFCDGQLMPISQNTALFSLVGTYYGGDGKSTFALPDLQGANAMHAGQGPGLSERFLGEQSGTDTITVLETEIPIHTHTLSGNNKVGDNPNPAGHTLGRYPGTYQQTTNSNLTPLAFQALPPAGSSFPHNNMMPYLGLNHCIALQGIFPPRQ